MATILTFSTQGDARIATPRRDTAAEVIVFPRTDIRALRRLSEPSTPGPLGGDDPASTPSDDGHA